MCSSDLLSDEFIEEARERIPELPDARRERYEASFGLRRDDTAGNRMRTVHFVLNGGWLVLCGAMFLVPCVYLL